jgi:hypothetical protein
MVYLIMLKSYFKKISNHSNKKSFIPLDMTFMRYSSDEKIGADAYKTNTIVHRCVSLIASGSVITLVT